MKKLGLTLLAILTFSTAAFSATIGTWNGAAGAFGPSDTQGWTSVTTPSGSGSFITGTHANMANNAWTLWSDSATSQARWDYVGGALTIGQTFSIDWANPAQLPSGNTWNLTINRADDTQAFRFGFVGGETFYTIQGSGSPVTEDSMNYTTSTLNLSFTLLSADTSRFTVTRKSDSVVLMDTVTSFALGGTAGSGLTSFVMNNGGQQGGSDLRFNTIAVVPEPSTVLLLSVGLVCVAFRRRNHRAA